MTTAAVNNSKQYVAACQLHRNCIMCGSNNPFGLRLDFSCPDREHVEATVNVPDRFQGYNGLAHGGVIASLLDSAMAHCLLKEGIVAVTGDMKIRFKKPVPVGRPLLLRGRMLEQRSKLYKMESELFMNDQLMAKATARFVHAPAELEIK